MKLIFTWHGRTCGRHAPMHLRRPAALGKKRSRWRGGLHGRGAHATLEGRRVYTAAGCAVSRTSAIFGVSSETTISTMNPSGIVTSPGWLNGAIARAGSIP